eukprot:Pgem_evm1s1247
MSNSNDTFDSNSGNTSDFLAQLLLSQMLGQSVTGEREAIPTNKNVLKDLPTTEITQEEI